MSFAGSSGYILAVWVQSLPASSNARSIGLMMPCFSEATNSTTNPSGTVNPASCFSGLLAMVLSDWVFLGVFIFFVFWAVAGVVEQASASMILR